MTTISSSHQIGSFIFTIHSNILKILKFVLGLSPFLPKLLRTNTFLIFFSYSAPPPNKTLEQKEDNLVYLILFLRKQLYELLKNQVIQLTLHGKIHVTSMVQLCDLKAPLVMIVSLTSLRKANSFGFTFTLPKMDHQV